MHALSEGIPTNTDLNTKKKEMDKILLNVIRKTILEDNPEKVFQYLDMLNFSQSLKLCVKLCEQLNQSELAHKVSQHLQEKEQKDIMLAELKPSSIKKDSQKVVPIS